MRQLFQTGETFTSLAMEIRELMKVDVIIANEDGIVVACTRNEHLNQFHEGAHLCFQKRQEMVITKELSEKLIGVEEAIMIPLLVEQVPVGVLGMIGDAKALNVYAPIARKLSELYLSNAIAQVSHDKKVENLELFVYDWLQDKLSHQQLMDRSKFFQIDVKKYRQVISIRLPFKTDEFSLQDLDELKDKWHGNRATMIVRWGQGKIIMLDEGLEKEDLKLQLKPFIQKLQDEFDQHVSVGVGQKMDYTEIAMSFKQAEEACVIAQKEGRVVFEEELRFELIQYDLDTIKKETFIERTIAPILHDETLLETLDYWLENNMSIQKTSEALSIHKNTLYYRLDKISTMTGLDVNNLHHIVLLYMSIHFLNE